MNLSMENKLLLVMAATGRGISEDIIQQIFEQQNLDDPNTQFLLQLLAQKQGDYEKLEKDLGSTTLEEPLNLNPSAIIDDQLVQTDTKETKQYLQRKIIDMYVELEEQRKRNELLSQALGACICWGIEPNCEHCGGHGSAGYYQIDRELFKQFVMPAVEQIYNRKESSEEISKKSKSIKKSSRPQ